MASDETMTVSSSMRDEEFDDTDDGYDHQYHRHHQSQNLSRLSKCTSSMYTNEDNEDDDGDEGMKMYMSRLSIESFDGDADDEKGLLPELSSDFDKEPGCYYLPETTPPPRRIRRGGIVVITRPKGGRRCLCMGMEEMKACRDLGFELEHELMLKMPSPNASLSGAALDDTSSGGNFPIANWRITRPGDDPRDVKARLKVWAQAVALASTSPHDY